MPDTLPDTLLHAEAMKVAAAQRWCCHECKSLLPPNWVDEPKVKANLGGSQKHVAHCSSCAIKIEQRMRKRAREDEYRASDAAKGGISATDLRILENMEVTFGKHDGQPLGSVPTSYLKWLVCGSKQGGYNCDWLQAANPRLHRGCTRLLAYRLLDVASELD